MHKKISRRSTVSLIGFALTLTCVARTIALAAPPKEPAPAGFEIKGDAEAGKKIFVANCASCHGKKGAGDGIAGLAAEPHPANFNDAQRFKDVTDWELYVAVKQGGPAVLQNAVMPPWGSTLSEAELQDVIAYVKASFIDPARKAAKLPAPPPGGQTPKAPPTTTAPSPGPATTTPAPGSAAPPPPAPGRAPAGALG